MPNPDRFLGRSGVYASARPGYPAELLDWLRSEGLLGHVVDVGAGTGLFTELLLRGAAHVTAVEPNPEMREKLSERLSEAMEAGQLTVLDGTSEGTGLPDSSVLLVTAAQAAHWFDPAPTLHEFRRVLQAGGRILFVWNDWRGSQQPFNVAYGETVSRFYRDGDDPQHINRVPEGEISTFMPGGFEKRVLDNPVSFTRERLHALAGSVSYLPGPGDPRYAEMTAALDEVFNEYAAGGVVTLHYRTHAFLGRP